MEKSKEQAKKIKKAKRTNRRRVTRRILLGLVFCVVAFMFFGAAYVLQLNAWNEFDVNKITGAPRSLLVYDMNDEQVSCLSGKETRIPIALSEVPEHVKWAFLCAEDARFYDHIGVDVIRIFGAAWEDIKAGGYVQGASTISQQLVKLSHLTDDKLMSRKIEEAVLAYQMEQQYSKDKILEMYLNYVYFGGGFYGIEAAARGYFGVPTKQLSVAQGAMLAAIVKSPSHYAPHLDMEASTNRRNLVLHLMNEYEHLSLAECEAAQKEPVTLTNSLKKNKRGFYIDLALQQACEVLNVSMTELLEGGYRLHLAMDTDLQGYCEELLLDDELFPEDSADVQAALVIVNADTGGVAALLGGRESTTALAFNRATRIRRQPGSVIKPIIAYAPALEKFGYTTVSMMLDEPTDFNGYQPSNFGERYRGWVTMREAVMYSLNIPAVKVLSAIGVDAGKAFAQEVGIPFEAQDNSLTLALGGFTYGVSPYQIAGAYAAFAHGGEYSTPSLLMSIQDANGNEVYHYKPERKRVMSEANAYILTDMLKSAIRDGTGKRLGELHMELAGKTGTTGEGKGNRDAWMAAYNPEYAAAVWMGYDDSSSGKTLPEKATGGMYPALILSKIFSRMYENKTIPVFTMPKDVVEVKIDGYTLANDHMAVLASALTPSASVTREVFAKGTEPSNISEYWVIPAPPNAFYAQINEAGFPSLRFQPEQSFILYRLYRDDQYGNTVVLGEWAGSTGTVQYEDKNVTPGETYSYYVVPTHPQLEIGGKQITGPATRKLTLRVPINPFILEGGLEPAGNGLDE